MPATKKVKDLSSILNTTFNSFKGIIIQSKGYTMKVTNIVADLVRKKDYNEINITFYYRFTYLRKDRKNNPLMEEELFERFVNDIVEQAVNAWESYEGIRTEVD